MTSPTVYDRLAAAYKDIAAMPFAKSGTVGAGRNSYRFIPIGTILQAVREVHAKHGILVLFGRPEYDTAQGEKRYSYTRKGEWGETTWYAANGHIDVRIIGGPREEDVIEMTVPCEAQDNSDKLTNKLITNAERCLYRTLYAIDEGDATDPEAENVPITPEPTKEAHRKAMAEQAQADRLFGGQKPLQKLAKEVVETSRKSDIADGIKGRYTAQYGQIDEWTRETMEACLADMREAAQ